jgi:hypothetical protein
MFTANSRYAKMATYVVTPPNGQTVTAVRLPPPFAGLALAGYHKRESAERLDQLAARYLQDATLFWKLCDANGTPAAAALEARPLIGIPLGGQ